MTLAATFFIVPFGPWRQKCFTKRLCPWRQKGYKRVTPLGSFLFEDPDPRGVTCILPFGPWRQQFFVTR